MCAISSLVAKSGAFAGTLGFPHLNKLLTHDDSGLSSTFFAIILFLTIVMIVSLGRLNKLEKYDESIGRSSAAHRYRTGNL